MPQQHRTVENEDRAGDDPVSARAHALLDAETMRSLIERLPLTVYIDRLDEESSNVYTSPQLEAELGYTVEEWENDSELFTRILHPDDRERVLAEHRRTGETGERFEVEYRLIAKDGSVHWYLDQAEVIPGADGKAEYHYGFLLEITDRKQLEEQADRDARRIRRQAQYVADLMEVAPLGVANVDPESNVVFWNPAVAGFFDVPREEAMGRPLADLMHEPKGDGDPQPRAADFLARALANGSDNAAGTYERPDGSRVDVEIFTIPVRGEDGDVIAFQVFFYDVTAAREAAEAQQRAEERYQELVEHLPLVTYIDEPTAEATSIYTSPQAGPMLGYPPEEWIGNSEFFASLLHPEDRESVIGEHARLFETGEREGVFEYRLRAKDGRFVWIRDQFTVIVDEDDKPLYTQGFMLDISDRKEAEESAHRQRQYFQGLLDVSPTAVVTIDPDDRIRSWNPAAERLFGYTAAEAVGQPIDALVAGEEVGHENLIDLKRVVAEGEIERITKRARKDGDLVDVQVRAAPITLDGELVGGFYIYHDISELQRAREQAEAATRAKSAFLATMSHEIRTPLNGVIGMTELLSGTDLTDEQRGFTEVIRTSGESLLTVINDVLDFSKLEADRVELEERPFVLAECVESAVEIVAATASEKGLDLASLVDADCPAAVVGDAMRLRQILTNLLTNAVKFTDSGEVVVTVSREDRDEEGRERLRLSVRDSGIGIPADRMHRLFESFTQVDASTTRRFGGSGLGLAISKRLAQAMGGDVWAESEEGRGSTFHVSVVLEAATTVPPSAEIDHGELRGARLLVVDDNAAAREVVRRHAESWGVAARTTASPAEALEWLRRGDPVDVAVLDMQMPELDGVMLAREIRGLGEGGRLPLVLLTSLGRRPEDDAGIGFAAMLTKPVKASQLHDALLLSLVGRRAISPPQEAPATVPPVSTKDLRILLAEDNEVNRRLALLMLERLGYAADVAVDGREALAALQREPYDVVLMDVEMPEMDGLEASREIHRLWPGSDRPRIVAMTANAMAGDREMCLAAGMDDYVSKPIDAGTLATALQRAALAGDAVASAPPADGNGSGGAGVLDAETLERLADAVGGQAVGELIDTFIESAPRLVANAREALASGDEDELRRAAHTLKSNGATFGAGALATSAAALEVAAADGPSGDWGQMLGEVEADVQRATSALAEVRHAL